MLLRYFPETLTTSPRIGRQGKALRRRQQRVIMPQQSGNCPPLHPHPHPHPDESLDKDGSSRKRCALFEKFSKSGMDRLNIKEKENVDYSGIWKEAEPFTEMIGAYWSLRAALGPVLETLILLDRLLLLQEEEKGVEVMMVPIFDPTISPRNMAIIAKKKKQ